MSWQQLLTVVQLMLLLHSSMVTCRTVEVNILSPTSWTPGGGDDSNSHSKAAYLSQLSEYLFDHSPGTFFRFMDHLCSSSSSSSSSSSINTTTTTATNGDEDDYWQPSTFDAAAEALIPTTLHSLMHTMTTVGHYTPTIQFFHSLLTEQLLAINSTVLSPPCGPGQPFIILTHGSTVVCNPQDLLQRLADDAVDDDSDTIRDNDNDDDDDIKEWEHVYVSDHGLDPTAAGRPSSTVRGGRGSSRRQHVILYGAIGTPTCCTLHRELVRLVETGSISTYRFRHSLLPTTTTTTTTINTTINEERGRGGGGRGRGEALQGFGVHLDIKNMEYKNVDDSSSGSGSSKKDASSSSSTSAATGEGDGDSDDGDGEVYDFSSSGGTEEEVMGVNFPALYKTVPGLGRELVMLREELLRVDAEEGGASVGDKGQMKVGRWSDDGDGDDGDSHDDDDDDDDDDDGDDDDALETG